VWPIILSDRLPIIALVGRYPTNQPNGTQAPHPAAPVPWRLSSRWSPSTSVRGISDGFPPLFPSGMAGSYVLLTRPPLTTRKWSVRLACITHAASVYPEPGSNSPYRWPSTIPGLNTITSVSLFLCVHPHPTSCTTPTAASQRGTTTTQRASGGVRLRLPRVPHRHHVSAIAICTGSVRPAPHLHQQYATFRHVPRHNAPAV